MDATGTWQSRFTHGLGVDEPLEIRQQSVPLYYHADGLGSIAAVTNASRAVAASYTYDSFGRWSVQMQIVTSPYGFTGREFDNANGATPGPGLYYYRARYYDPSVGRFLSQDPIRFEADSNFYRFVSNSPQNWVDLFGLDVTVIMYEGEGPNTFGHVGIQVNEDPIVGFTDSSSFWDPIAAAGNAVPGGR